MTHSAHTPASPKAKAKRPLAPDTARLDPRSARAWTEPMATAPLGGGRYAVESSTSEYRVDLTTSDCTCPDHGYRGARCKHLRRVAVEVTRGDLPAPGRLPGDCAACSRERYLPEDGPGLCNDCWFDRDDTVRDRETGDLVVVVRVTDTPASEWTVAGAGRTVADYETNGGYPADDPVVEVIYPFAAPRQEFDELQRYAFPHSRLESAETQLIA